MSRVLITGGSGFIGTNLVDSLASGGFEVLNFDVRTPLNHEHAQFHRAGDILDADRLSGVLHEFHPDYVVHLAARTDLLGSGIGQYQANTVGVTNLIEAIRRQPSVGRVLFASSRYVHRTEVQPESDCEYSPFTAYGESKVAGEGIVRGGNLDIPWLLVRPTSIWGPWFDIPYKGFFAAVRKGVYVHPAGEKLFKSYGFVGNVVHQIRKFLECPAGLIHGKTFYVADYKPLEVREFAELIRAAFGAPPVREAPLIVMKTLAVGGDAMKKLGMRNPPLTSFRLNNLRAQMIYDLSATENVVGPLPYGLKQGAEHTVEWMKEFGS
jgi:nucleoside-diphosphate-sugar epimerase